jgi:hypothetical protein
MEENKVASCPYYNISNLPDGWGRSPHKNVKKELYLAKTRGELNVYNDMYFYLPALEYSDYSLKIQIKTYTSKARNKIDKRKIMENPLFLNSLINYPYQDTIINNNEIYIYSFKHDVYDKNNTISDTSYSKVALIEGTKNIYILEYGSLNMKIYDNHVNDFYNLLGSFTIK